MIMGKKTSIEDLPDELVREIMLVMMEPPTKSQEPEGFLHLNSPIFSTSFPVTPFPLTQVCRRWRRIACSTRSLWRSIAITYPGQRHIHRVKMWLSYGDGHRLDIALRQSDDLHEEERRATVEILGLLVQRVHKWANVEFHFTQDDLPALVVNHMHRIRTSKPSMLQKMTISHMFQVLELRERVVDMWGSLQDIPVKHLEWLSSAPVTAFSSTNLHTLVSSGFTFKIFVATLRLCPNLKAIDVRLLDEPPMDTNGRYRRVEHAHLRKVAIKGHNTDIKIFLRLFTFPSLVSIELDAIDASACIHLWRLLRRSNCMLSSLVLQVRNAQGLDVAGWFEQHVLQNLETLVISGAEINDHVLLMLTCPPLRGNRPTYFEKLKYLSLARTMPDVDDSILLRMLGSRFWTPQGSPAKTNLVTAGMRVSRKTNPMAMYEKMINACAARMAESKDKSWRYWKNRSLQIE